MAQQHVESSGPGIEPVPPALAGEFLTTCPPEKSPVCFLDDSYCGIGLFLLLFYTKYAGGFLRREPGRKNGRKAVVWPGGEMTVARGMERGKKSSGFLKAKASSGILM